MNKLSIIVSVRTFRDIVMADGDGRFIRSMDENHCELTVWSIEQQDFIDSESMLRQAPICDMLVFKRLFAEDQAVLEYMRHCALARSRTIVIGTSELDCKVAEILRVKCAVPSFLSSKAFLKDCNAYGECVVLGNMQFLHNYVFHVSPRDPCFFKNDCVTGLKSGIKIPEDPFSKKDIYKPLTEDVVDEVSCYSVLHVRNVLMLIQALDKVKYTLRKEGKKVFYRGQNMLYPNGGLVPSRYRCLLQKKEKFVAQEKGKIDKEIDGQIKAFKSLPRYDRHGKMMRGTVKKDKLTLFETKSDCVIEGLFQQYERSSRWIDAVDNIWNALWFSCHRRWGCDGVVQYRRRIPSLETSEHRFAYVLVLAVSNSLGSKRSRVIDLREETDSLFVRPHIQHGVLLQSLQKDINGRYSPEVDMSSLIHGVIRIDLQTALEWLGNSPALDPTSIFPMPAFDVGFRELIHHGSMMNPPLVFH